MRQVRRNDDPRQAELDAFQGLDRAGDGLAGAFTAAYQDEARGI